MRVKEIGEFALIEKMMDKQGASREDVVLGIGDDAAITSFSDTYEEVMSMDTMVEGVHFTKDSMRFYDVGYRLTTANLSDMAAMGATPKFALISLALPKEYLVSDVEQIYVGLDKQCSTHGVSVIGGDTVSTTGPLVLTMTMIGEAPKGRALRRSGAKVGDWIGVTKTLGLSAVGLDAIVRGEKGYFTAKDAYQRPNPAVSWGKRLLSLGAHAANDVSDGLASELYEMAEASEVRFHIDMHALPLHEEVKAWGRFIGENPVDYALYGGEDFQLVFTVSEDVKEKLSEESDITFIGRVVEGRGVYVYQPETEDWEILPRGGYDHFTNG